ncbi:MAG TPA: alpha-2-macroglobulin, partial [Chitinophagaceae bacterium]|nr:alpha-2-macroglobulin [Chitinophagaceae bacterium]
MPIIKSILLTMILFSLMSTGGSGQGLLKNYEKEWKKVEVFAKKGLPKSALEETKKIYILAKAEKQDAQVIKALVYMTALQSENREDNEIFSIAEMEKEIAGSKEPVTSILKSFQAEIYYNYYQQHRWQLYDRTQTANFNKTDIATWDAEDFHKKMTELYLQSIKEERLLQQTRPETFDAIIVKGNMRHLRPTLYDLLTHRALNYFEDDERDIKKPAYAFEINQASAFDPAADFVTRKFTTKDSFSLQHKALLIYQELIIFHLKDAKPDALIDADLQRIQFVRSKSTHPDKEQLYFNAINHIANQYGNTPAAAQAWYLVAAWHEQKANEYKPYGDSTNRFSRVKAKEILEKIVAQKDSSEGKMNAYNLLKTINSRSFQFSVEKVNVPGQPFRTFVKYRNTGALYFKVVRTDENLKKQLENQSDEKYWPALIAADPVKSWQQSLPATNDLQQHSVEIKIDALPGGDYILVASSEKDFAAKKAILGARLFYVSDISYINSSEDFFVLNRDNGKPLASAAVQVWEQKYDYKQSRYVKEKGKAYTTDANGFFKMDRSKRDNNNYSSYSYLLDITHGKDKLFMNDYVYDYYYYQSPETENPKTATSVYLFTDRSIYRPGQTVFFKGIVLTHNPANKTGGVKADYSTTVILRDANYKDV